MVLSVSVQVQLDNSDVVNIDLIGNSDEVNIRVDLIFVQCWEKTSLHSLSLRHTGCHSRMAAACEASQPSGFNG